MGTACVIRLVRVFAVVTDSLVAAVFRTLIAMLTGVTQGIVTIFISAGSALMHARVAFVQLTAFDIAKCIVAISFVMTADDIFVRTLTALVAQFDTAGLVLFVCYCCTAVRANGLRAILCEVTSFPTSFTDILAFAAIFVIGGLAVSSAGAVGVAIVVVTNGALAAAVLGAGVGMIAVVAQLQGAVCVIAGNAVLAFVTITISTARNSAGDDMVASMTQLTSTACNIAGNTVLTFVTIAISTAGNAAGQGGAVRSMSLGGTRAPVTANALGDLLATAKGTSVLNKIRNDHPALTTNNGAGIKAITAGPRPAGECCFSTCRQCSLGNILPSAQRHAVIIIGRCTCSGNRLTININMDANIVTSSKSMERHHTNQQNSNQQQTEHLLHYCFHFVF